jgi:hypothetical protein
MTMRTKLLVFCPSLLAILLNTSWASAATDDVATLRQKARVECAAGNYQVGVRLLAELWVTTKDPTWIYNQARCYEQNGQNQLAISRFREYLRVSPSLPTNEINAVKQRIDELQSQLVQPNAPLPPEPPPPLEPKTNVTISQPEVAQPAPSDLGLTSAPPEPAPTQPVYQRWWFWTGVGALVVGGVVTGILLSTRSAPKSPGCEDSIACAQKF